MSIESTTWRFTVSDYHRMHESGIFGEDDRIELLDGEVRHMSPIGSRHAAIVSRLTALLVRLASDAAIVSVQNPIQLTDYSEPQPDFAVLRPRNDYYAADLPKPELLLIEVADSSAAYDRTEKLPRYAAARIEEVWIVAVETGTVKQYRSPRGDQYAFKQTFQAADELRSASLASLVVIPDQLFG